MQNEMRKEKPSVEQEKFAECVLKIISPTVEQFEFKLHRQEIRKYSTTIVWRKENQYVKINSTTYPPDGLYYNVVLGEGNSDDFFEYDWNSVGIWALARIIDPKAEVVSYDFPFDNVEVSVENANKDLCLYGGTFLKGNLTIFHEAKEKIHSKRQYINIALKDGTLLY